MNRSVGLTLIALGAGASLAWGLVQQSPHEAVAATCSTPAPSCERASCAPKACAQTAGSLATAAPLATCTNGGLVRASTPLAATSAPACGVTVVCGPTSVASSVTCSSGGGSSCVVVTGGGGSCCSKAGATKAPRAGARGQGVAVAAPSPDALVYLAGGNDPDAEVRVLEPSSLGGVSGAPLTAIAQPCQVTTQVRALPPVVNALPPSVQVVAIPPLQSGSCAVVGSCTARGVAKGGGQGVAKGSCCSKGGAVAIAPGSVSLAGGTVALTPGVATGAVSIAPSGIAVGTCDTPACASKPARGGVAAIAAPGSSPLVFDLDGGHDPQDADEPEDSDDGSMDDDSDAEEVFEVDEDADDGEDADDDADEDADDSGCDELAQACVSLDALAQDPSCQELYQKIQQALEKSRGALEGVDVASLVQQAQAASADAAMHLDKEEVAKLVRKAQEVATQGQEKVYRALQSGQMKVLRAGELQRAAAEKMRARYQDAGQRHDDEYTRKLERRIAELERQLAERDRDEAKVERMRALEERRRAEDSEADGRKEELERAEVERRAERDARKARTLRGLGYLGGKGGGGMTLRELPQNGQPYWESPEPPSPPEPPSAPEPPQARNPMKLKAPKPPKMPKMPLTPSSPKLAIPAMPPSGEGMPGTPPDGRKMRIYGIPGGQAFGGDPAELEEVQKLMSDLRSQVEDLRAAMRDLRTQMEAVSRDGLR